MADGPVATVVIIDDHPIVRASLRALLETAGFEVREFCSAGEFLRARDATEASCLLVDIHLPGINGIELQEELQERGSWAPVIIMTGQADVPLALRAMRAGATDLLEKPFDSKSLLRAIASAVQLRHLAKSKASEAEDAKTRIGQLTNREMDVFKGLTSGHSSKIIAHHLGISHRTVEIYRPRIFKKLNAGSVADIVRTARAAGLLA